MTPTCTSDKTMITVVATSALDYLQAVNSKASLSTDVSFAGLTENEGLGTTCLVVDNTG